jgi:Mg2+-importing ATPase
MQQSQTILWNSEATALLSHLETTAAGLSDNEAAGRLRIVGPNTAEYPPRFPRARLFGSQLKSPIAILLAVAASISSVVGDAFDGITILGILLASTALGFWQELQAHDAVQRLLKRLQSRVDTLRNGAWQSIPSTDLVPGDIIALSAGSHIPADCRIITARDLSVDESSLTGESFPTEKRPGVVPSTAPPSDRSNAVFMGTHIISGAATALVPGALMGQRKFVLNPDKTLSSWPASCTLH